VLPAAQKASLDRIVERFRHRATVFGEWGFARLTGASGATALFHGPRGTGKTMAAEAIARRLDLALFRVDLAALVSTYIGETEKNIDRVFDAAEGTGAMLFFDEADALFGKRTDLKDSHDRYANIEVAYLLKRMEAYSGLVVLTSNATAAIDDSVRGRIGVVVTFPVPDAAARDAIWRRVFPASAPLGDLDYPTLAQLKMTGGEIRRAATEAAFLAAAAGDKITTEHVLKAAGTTT
jgi:SpoVK/Ycf46/Vps4 family AAA+-type ATPase